MNKTKLFFLSILILGLSPHMQLFPLDVTVSGRWFYVAGFGLVGLIGTVLPKKYMYFLIVPILIYSVITLNRTYDYKNGLILYTADIKKNIDNYNLENNLGVEYYRIGNIDKACVHFQKSVDLSPKWWTNYNNLGVCKESQGELDEALAFYRAAIDNGRYYLAYENYAKILIKQNKLEEAEEFLSQTIKIFPENVTLQGLLQQLVSR